MAHTKAAVAGKTAKAREAKAKRLEKRVAKLEKEKEEEREHTKLWRANYLKEQRDFEERAWRQVLWSLQRKEMTAEVPSSLLWPHPTRIEKATPKTTKHSAQAIPTWRK